jgi:hypothetical protein
MGARRLVQNVFDVFAVQTPGNESLGCALRKMPLAQPPQEMQRLIGQRAHLRGRHIQQMMIEGTRVGQSVTQTLANLYDRDLSREPVAHQLHGHQSPAAAAAYDGNVTTMVFSLYRHIAVAVTCQLRYLAMVTSFQRKQWRVPESTEIDLSYDWEIPEWTKRHYMTGPIRQGTNS